MNAKELRIGNITTFGIVCEITDACFRVLDEEGCEYSSKWADIQPALLTEEWLIKFRFVPNNYNDEFYFGIIDLDCEYTDKGEYNVRVQNANIALSIRYVHQLQNLYFALIGEELKEAE